MGSLYLCLLPCLCARVCVQSADKESSLIAVQVLQVLSDHVDLLLDKLPDLITHIVQVMMLSYLPTVIVINSLLLSRMD